MFNLPALIKLINTNSDTTIQKSEMSEFLKSQDSEKPSVFTEYFNSINSDISVGKFIDGINDVINQAYDKEQNPNLELNFKQQEVREKYEQIKNEMELHDRLYSEMGFGYKFKSDEDFDSAFSELISKYRDKGADAEGLIYEGLMEKAATTSPLDMLARISTGKFTYVGTDFQDIEFDDVDLKPYADAFKYINFNEKTFAKVSPEHLPEGFNPQEILAKGRTVGLGIDQAHANGYTGEGVSFAVIDSGTLCDDGLNEDGTRKLSPHKGLNFKEYNTTKNPSPYINHFHGLATSYIAQEIAPSADLYYYADSSGNALLEHLQAILDKNETLPDDQKIRVVSMSFSLEGDREKALPLVKELEAKGVWVFSSSEQFWNKGFGYMEKKDPNGNVNDISNYQIYLSEHSNADPKPEPIYVTSGDRTVPDTANPNAYRHDSSACASWAIPVVAGYYTLACQADPSMTPDRFMQLARSTAQTTTSTVPNWEDDVMVSRSKEEIEIKVIDINALLQAIENEKSQQAQ